MFAGRRARITRTGANVQEFERHRHTLMGLG